MDERLERVYEYIELYNEEKVLFGKIGPLVKERGFLEFREFYKICMWKSSRQKKKYIENSESVEKVSRKAFFEKDEIKKIKILCEGLKGVGIPTASAILSVVWPERYAVIDVRCLDMLNEIADTGIKKSMSYKNWLNYLMKMRELSREHNITPRQLDMALFAMHKEKLDKDFENLYG